MRTTGVPLRLHFDVNKTLNFVDPVKGETLEQAVTRMLCDATWGHVTESGDWQWDEQAPTAQRPTGVAVCVSYTEFLQRHRQLSRTNEIEAQTQFLAAGHPGHKEPVIKAFDTFIEKLSLDAATIMDARNVGLGDLLRRSYFLLPAFFRLLEHLRDTGREFSLVFRTFGVDLPSVKREFNVLCRGRHPLSDFSMPTKRLDPVRMVSLWRRDEAPHVALVPGYGWDSDDELKAETELTDIPVPVLLGDANVRSFFNDVAAAGRTLGVRDMHDHWKTKGKQSIAGKLCYVDRSARRHLTVFFDDNVKEEDAYIVDLRDEETGDPLPFKEATGTFLVRVVPFEMLLDDNYYIKALKACEERLGAAKSDSQPMGV